MLNIKIIIDINSVKYCSVKNLKEKYLWAIDC